jgi:hypothetical protein
MDAERAGTPDAEAADMDTEIGERPSGVPPPGGLGASKRELYALLAALVIFAAIIAGFWLEARP